MRCRKGDWVAEENSNVEVDHDIIGRLVVSLDSEVMSGFASPHSPALDFPLSATECMCALCGSQRFVSQLRRAFATKVAYKSHPRKQRTCCDSEAAT